MCGILGVWNNTRDLSKAVNLLEHRGKEHTGFWDGSELTTSLPQSQTILTHCLHAIVNTIPQPLQRKGVIAANCEIYNWKELATKHDIEAKNDADLLLQLLDNLEELSLETVTNLLHELDGVYAIIYQRDKQVFFFRDLLGVKPLWFSNSENLAIASEKKILHAATYTEVEEANPQEVYLYNTESKEIKNYQKDFFHPATLTTQDEIELIKQTKDLIIKAVQKRIPDKKIKVGVLLSGGVDSTLLAKVCQDLDMDIVCYTSVMDDGENKPAHDLSASIEVSKEYKFNHKILKILPEELPGLAKECVSLLEEADAVKVSVAIPFLVATKQAHKDGCKILFSGLGAEELFAGYKRHKDATDINAECIAGLLAMHNRDLYRDDVLTMRNGLELRLPFLDKELIKFSLALPAELKIHEGIEKYILRKASLLVGLEQAHAFRPKKAAQYGSKVDRILKKIANKEKKTRKEYLSNFL